MAIHDQDAPDQRNGAAPSRRGPAETFTGQVRLDAHFQAPEPSRVSTAHVTFEPGAPPLAHPSARPAPLPIARKVFEEAGLS